MNSLAGFMLISYWLFWIILGGVVLGSISEKTNRNKRLGFCLGSILGILIGLFLGVFTLSILVIG